jgi:hypothetical protein
MIALLLPFPIVSGIYRAGKGGRLTAAFLSRPAQRWLKWTIAAGREDKGVVITNLTKPFSACAALLWSFAWVWLSRCLRFLQSASLSPTSKTATSFLPAMPESYPSQ